MTTDAACRSCGTELRQGAKFCDECGSPTTFSADAAKYKQVTVLFADVVRSMDIAAALDVERLREIMADLVQRSTAVVQRYGGGSVEYTGDGVMAIFGAPVALEDHAFRACLAALAIQEEAKQLATEVQRRDGVALQLRVGLNSGRVIAGALGGSAPLRYAAIGEPVGFAQRMESVAPAGGVMLSESTARLVEQSVAMTEPERVHIKGADEPVVARRLTGIRARDDQLLRAEGGPRRTALGDGGHRRDDARCDRRPRGRGERCRTGGNRQVPGGAGGCRGGRRSGVPGVLGLL